MNAPMTKQDKPAEEAEVPTAPRLRVAADNEWDPLQAVLLGNAEGAQVPRSKDRALQAIDYPGSTAEAFTAAPCGPYPEEVIEETVEDLARFAEQLQRLGVEVHRPAGRDFREQQRGGQGPGWSVDGYYNYCPRDSITVIGERVIASPMVLRHRQRECEALRPLFAPECWVDCPRPSLSDAMYDPHAEEGTTLLDVEPAFDAANLLRFGKDILFLISNTGNRRGAALLQELLGPEYRVHLVADIYRDRHIDTTFLPLREGLLLANPARLTQDDIPAFLKDWEILWSPEMVPLPALDAWCPASEWIGMNLLSIRPDLAAVESNQLPLMRALERRGVDCLPVRLRHSRTLGGGPHCVSVDLRRG